MTAVGLARGEVGAFFSVRSSVLRQPMARPLDFTGPMRLGGSASMMVNSRRDRLAVIRVRQIMCLGRWLEIIEVIADFVTRKNVGGHQLRSHIALGVAQKEAIAGIYFRPNIGRRGDGQARCAGGTAEDVGIHAFASGQTSVR